MAAANEAEKTVTTAQAELVSRSKTAGLLLLEAKKLHPRVKDFEAFLKHYGTEHAFFSRLADKRMKVLRGGQPGTVLPREPAAVVPLATTPSAAAEAEIEAAAENVILRIEAGMHTTQIKRISLNADGRIECDLTVSKLGSERFLVVASDTAHGHARAWLRDQVGEAACSVTDVTRDLAQAEELSAAGDSDMRELAAEEVKALTEEFTGAAELQDDLTLLLLRRLGPPTS